MRGVELGVDLDDHLGELVEVHLPVPIARHQAVLDVVGEAAVEPLVLLRVVVQLGFLSVDVEAGVSCTLDQPQQLMKRRRIGGRKVTLGFDGEDRGK